MEASWIFIGGSWPDEIPKAQTLSGCWISLLNPVELSNWQTNPKEKETEEQPPTSFIVNTNGRKIIAAAIADEEAL